VGPLVRAHRQNLRVHMKTQPLDGNQADNPAPLFLKNPFILKSNAELPIMMTKSNLVDISTEKKAPNFSIKFYPRAVKSRVLTNQIIMKEPMFQGFKNISTKN
jgi:hypothetical protein